MTKITILCVGKIKESFYRDAVAEYQKRLSKYAKVDIIEVADERTKENPTDAERQLVLSAEAERLLAHLPPRAYTIALDICGQELDSVSFAKFINDRQIERDSHLIFTIGGSLGLSEDIKEKVDFCLSFSSMTFPHQLMRVILLEQIYRSYRIINNEPYHK